MIFKGHNSNSFTFYDSVNMGERALLKGRKSPCQPNKPTDPVSSRGVNRHLSSSLLNHAIPIRQSNNECRIQLWGGPPDLRYSHMAVASTRAGAAAPPSPAVPPCAARRGRGAGPGPRSCSGPPRSHGG